MALPATTRAAVIELLDYCNKPSGCPYNFTEIGEVVGVSGEYGQLKLKVSPATAKLCRFLEAHGLRFCVDFGTENAAKKVMELPPETDKLQ